MRCKVDKGSAGRFWMKGMSLEQVNREYYKGYDTTRLGCISACLPCGALC